MRVNIKDNVYGMSRKEYKKFLKVARNSIPCGIYAVEKGNTAIMLNEKYNDIENLRKAVNEYKKIDFKVFWNDKLESRKNRKR